MKHFSALLAALLVATAAVAAPAWRGPLTKRLPDGTTATYYLHGDEHYHYMTDAAGQFLQEAPDGTLQLLQQAPPRRPAAEAPALARTKASDYQIGTFPTRGDAHALIILAETSDVPMTFGQEYHQRLMNEEGFSLDGNNGSARDYFIAQSQGLFQPTFDVVGPVRLSRTMNYYGRNDNFYNQDENTEVMIVEACKLAHDELGVDFSQYDYDEDGFVDMVYVIFAGYGENAGGGANTVWPKKWSIQSAGQNLTLDNKQIDVYACSAELFGNSGAQSGSIGAFCHEFGHVLGFADHYSTTNSSRYELGSYDLMDYGVFNNDSRTPPSYNAFERMTVGWLTPQELTVAEDDVALSDIQQSNTAYRITSRRNPQEFYLLENRQKTGWDAYLPSDGLMITHCDFDMAIWNQNQVNNDDDHRRFYLVCADGDDQYDFQAQRTTEAYDLYPLYRQNGGNNSFTDSSNPAAKPYTGEVLDKWVTNIRLGDDGLVRFDFMSNHLKTPTELHASGVTDEAFTAQWTAADSRAESYTLAVTHLMREPELQVPVQEDFHLMAEGQVGAGSSADVSQQLDEYMTQVGWTGENVFQAGGTAQLGKTGTGGQLVSPPLNFSLFDRSFAVLVKVSSQVGSQPVFSVSANGLQGRTRLTSTPRMYLFQFDGAGLTATTVTLGVQNERAYIDSLIIVRGTAAAQLYPKAKAVAVQGTPASTTDEEVEVAYIHAEQTLYTDITDTHFTVTQGLAAGERYALQVQALSGQSQSEWTAEHILVLSRELAVDALHPSPLTLHHYYDLSGKPVQHPSHPGIYLVRQGEQVRKVVVR